MSGLDIADEEFKAFAASLEQMTELEVAGKPGRVNGLGGYANTPIDASLAMPGVTDTPVEDLGTHLVLNLGS